MLLFCKKLNSLELRDKSNHAIHSFDGCCIVIHIKENEWIQIQTCYASPGGRGMRIKAFSEAKTLNSMVRAPNL
ncbi:hypothetical protein UABAM_05371 [Candidatus Uabimicrobium amorphum]|uniref:Uncharacterized protein n=1 Tax=Uabimicrobium amorphum TaxID=2596890 RepID=A0A5S9IRW8_UABAM|nr:hypothetical protein UABAM_05371 [Candidatus Uabimicrobium amorphum]